MLMAFGKGRDEAATGQPKDEVTDQRRRLTVLCGALAGVTAASLGLAAWSFAGSQAVRSTYETNLVSVVTATRDVPAGTTLAATDVQVSEVPSAYVPSKAVTDAADVVGRVALVDLSQGLAIPSGDVQGASDSTLAQAMDAGKVAYSIAVSADEGVAGLLRVGDRVSVLAGANGVDPEVVAQGARVLALDASTSSSDAPAQYATVTVELGADQAEELFQVLGVANGTCHLTLEPQGAKDGRL